MKNFFKKLGFRKMDEMEQHIAFKAQRNALIFLVLALFIIDIYENYKVIVYHTQITQINLLPNALLIGAILIQSFSQIILTRKAVKGDDEYSETSPVLKIILVVFVVTAIIATGVAVIIFNR